MSTWASLGQSASTYRSAKQPVSLSQGGLCSHFFPPSTSVPHEITEAMIQPIKFLHLKSAKFLPRLRT